MFKKLLAITLPVLMALSSCDIVQERIRQDGLEGFKEDTVAHEEIFGAAEQLKGPAVHKMDVLGESAPYKVGYQIHFDDKGNADPADDVISIRFIAAIKTTYSSMVWSRGLAGPAGQDPISFSSNSTAV